jgi:hypothetical protein
MSVAAADGAVGGRFKVAEPSLLLPGGDDADVFVGIVLSNLPDSHPTSEHRKREFNAQETRQTTMRGLPVYIEHNETWHPVGLTVGYRVVEGMGADGGGGGGRVVASRGHLGKHGNGKKRPYVETVHMLNREPDVAPTLGAPDQHAVEATRLQRCRLMMGVDRGLSLGHRFRPEQASGTARATIVKRLVEISTCPRGKRPGTVIEHYFPCARTLQKSDEVMVREFCKVYGYSAPSHDCGERGSEPWARFIDSLSSQVAARRAAVFSRPGFENLAEPVPRYHGVVRASASSTHDDENLALESPVDKLVSLLFGPPVVDTDHTAAGALQTFAPPQTMSVDQAQASAATLTATGTAAASSSSTASAMATDAPSSSAAAGESARDVPQVGGALTAEQTLKIDEIAAVGNDAYEAFRMAAAKSEALEKENERLKQEMSEYNNERKRTHDEQGEKKRARTVGAASALMAAMHSAAERLRDHKVLPGDQLNMILSKIRESATKASDAVDEQEVQNIYNEIKPTLELAVQASDRLHAERLNQQHAEVLRRKNELNSFFARMPTSTIASNQPAATTAFPTQVQQQQRAPSFGQSSAAPWGTVQASATRSDPAGFDFSFAGANSQLAASPADRLFPPQQQQQQQAPFDISAPGAIKQLVDAHIAATGCFPSEDELLRGGLRPETRVINSFNGQQIQETTMVPVFSAPMPRSVLTPTMLAPEFCAAVVSDVQRHFSGETVASGSDMKEMRNLGLHGLVNERFEPRSTDGWTTPISTLKAAVGAW